MDLIPLRFDGGVYQRADGTQVIAHRGASAYAAEHTLAAYELALAQGADALELDVRATADGELVVLHDPTLLRTAGDPRAVATMTAHDLDALPAAVRPLRLEAVLARFGRATRWLVDLKDPDPAWEGRLATAIERHGLGEHAVVQSFDRRSLERLHAAAPWLAVAPLYLRPRRVRAELDTLSTFATGIGVWHASLDRALVLRAHARGLTVRAWTANEPSDVARLLGLGVDGVITDRPDVARAITSSLAAPPLAA